jgi:hypothetical protein
MPIAYPNISSKKFLSKIKQNDHWNARSHKVFTNLLILVTLSLELNLVSQIERNWLIKQFQEFARLHHARISFLSGDVSCAAVGVFKTHAKDKVTQKNDYRYMVNVVTSKFFFLVFCRGVCLFDDISFLFFSFSRCHCEYTAVSRSILFSTLAWVFFKKT